MQYSCLRRWAQRTWKAIDDPTKCDQMLVDPFPIWIRGSDIRNEVVNISKGKKHKSVNTQDGGLRPRDGVDRWEWGKA